MIHRARSRELSPMDFVKGVFSDGGQPSFSRVASGVLVIVGIIWVSYLVFSTGKMPDLLGLAALIATPYGVNVAGNAFNRQAPPKE